MGSRKKKLSNFFSPATKALPTTPLELSGHIFLRTFFSRASKKTFSFLSGQTLTPPPLLVAGPLRTDLFAASLTRYGNHLLNKPWPAWQLCIQEVLSIKNFQFNFPFSASGVVGQLFCTVLANYRFYDRTAQYPCTEL